MTSTRRLYPSKDSESVRKWATENGLHVDKLIEASGPSDIWVGGYVRKELRGVLFALKERSGYHQLHIRTVANFRVKHLLRFVIMAVNRLTDMKRVAGLVAGLTGDHAGWIERVGRKMGADLVTPPGGRNYMFLNAP